jgi:hypothetical protein
MKITTINGKETNISGIGEAILKLPGGTIIRIGNAIHIPTATKDLLSYKDFRNNDLHVSTATRLGKECLLITKNGIVLEKFIGLRNGLCETTIKQVTSNVEVFSSTLDKKEQLFRLWHQRLGHPGKRSLAKTLKAVQDANVPTDIVSIHDSYCCAACAKGKIQNKPKTSGENDQRLSTNFFDWIYVDICGPIDPPSAEFNYFMVINDGSSRYIDIHLL